MSSMIHPIKLTTTSLKTPIIKTSCNNYGGLEDAVPSTEEGAHPSQTSLFVSQEITADTPSSKGSAWVRFKECASHPNYTMNILQIKIFLKNMSSAKEKILISSRNESFNIDKLKIGSNSYGRNCANLLFSLEGIKAAHNINLKQYDELILIVKETKKELVEILSELETCASGALDKYERKTVAEAERGFSDLFKQIQNWGSSFSEETDAKKDVSK